jgi:hypothetical protein
MALFQRKRDRIEVKLNDDGRDFVAMVARAVLEADGDPTHVWHQALHAPIAPSRDADDPLAMAARQQATDTAAELVLVTLRDASLTDDEAWAWLRTLQIGLRSVAVAEELSHEADLESSDAAVRNLVDNLQALLWSLGKALAS